MIPWQEALRLVLHHCPPPQSIRVAALDALGCVLAESIACDLDSPPYDKALMDGYAVRSIDAADPPCVFSVIETVAAGQTPRHAITAGRATRIMTGAPLPDGADAVVMFEHATARGDDSVVIEKSVRPGDAILRRGASMRSGDVILEPGHVIRPIEVGLLAEVGRVDVLAFARPSLAVLTTGDELAPPQATPGPGQIRNSNGPMLAALAQAHGARPRALPHAADEADALAQRINEGLNEQALVLCGGVSAGMLDLVPAALQRCGVSCVFHGVHMKPGKPIWFGVHPRGTLVFGLPGNPVSSLACFLMFVRPALARMAGRQEHLATRTAPLAQAYYHRSDRPTFYPARVNDQGTVDLLAWQGSADLRGLAQANCLALLESGPRQYDLGDPLTTYDFT